MRNFKFLFIFILTHILISCAKEMRFNKMEWSQKSDLGDYPKRDNMINDLINKYKLKGLSYEQVMELLGEPENFLVSESNVIYYNIVTDYGTDIDPVYVKNLKLSFTKDSIINDYSIEELKK